MRDVARAVDLSPMTVSRALRGDPTVNAKTLDLVRKTASELGYVYDSTAQAFRTQKSGFVAVSLPSINNANFAETFRGLTEGVDGQSIQLLLGSTNYQVQKEHALVLQLLARKPEAVILTGGFHLPETFERRCDGTDRGTFGKDGAAQIGVHWRDCGNGYARQRTA